MLEGVLAGIERGWFQQAIAESAFREQRRYESGDLTKVGVNAFVDRHDEPVDTLVIGPEGEREQIEAWRACAPNGTSGGELGARGAWSAAAGHRENLIQPLVDCARSLCTEGRDRLGAHGGLRRLPRDTSVLGRGASSTNKITAPAHNSTAQTAITHRKPSANDARTASWICARAPGARPSGGDSAPCSRLLGTRSRLRSPEPPARDPGAAASARSRRATSPSRRRPGRAGARDVGRRCHRTSPRAG